jgi:transcriptional regulator with XRE-family HTH domain
MTTAEALAALVRAEVEASGRRQYEIAAAVGITVKHLSRFMCGHDGMSLDLIDAVLDACDRRLVLATVPAADEGGAAA